ncbi:MAG: peptidyl-prolyl cis-trans isomerase [Opitutaceae bacterium]|jgi:peptidyl-prolyl cis-trans isomerase D|nr:peptidyl-prolyl cis-trans isomerase [Opitutaceae bacterium]
MISWIQNTFQRHFRVIFAVLLIVIIISFVFVTNASSGLGRADRRVETKPFFDLNLASPADNERLSRDAALSIELQYGFPANGDMLQRFAYPRYTALYLANKLRIPEPAQSEKVAHIRGMRRFAGQDGQFDAASYQAFLKGLSAAAQGEIARVISDDIRIERVHALLSGPGYVLPADVKQILEEQDTRWTIDVASIDRASFAPAIAPSDAAIADYFQKNSFLYTIAPKVNVSYAEFTLNTAIASVRPATPEQLREFYDANPARFPQPAGAPKVEDSADPKLAAAAAFERVRPQVESAWRAGQAALLAGQAASDFAVAVFDSKEKGKGDAKPGTKVFSDLLFDHKAAYHEARAFAEGDVPVELTGDPRVAAQISAQAFSLGDDRRVSDAIQTERGDSIVLFWNSTIPSRDPALEEVRERVVADYTENEKRRLFIELGQTVRASIEAALKSGKTFAQAAESAAGAAGVKSSVSSLADFTRREPPEALTQQAGAALQSLNQGDVSAMVATPDSGILVYARAKTLPDATEANPRYIETRDQIASYYGRAAASAYINDMMNKELGRTAQVAVE